MTALGSTPPGLNDGERWFLDRCDPETMTSLQSGRLVALRERASSAEALVIDGLLARIPAPEGAGEVPDTAALSGAMQAGRDAGRAADVIGERFQDVVAARLAAGRKSSSVVPRASDSPSPFDTLHVVGRPYGGDAA